MTKRFNRSLLALALPFTAAMALLPSAASAQFNDNLGYHYNNPMSATIGTYLNEQNKMLFARQSLFNAMVRSSQNRPGASSAGSQEQRGRDLIAKNQATMAFPMREFPLSKWLYIWGAGSAQKRDQAAKEWGEQKALWANEIQARGAKPGDMAEMMALAFVSCVEGYTGERINNAGFHYMSGEFRKAWLKDPSYQGRTVVSKQELYEESLLTSTYALSLRRQAQKTGDSSTLPQARLSAARFLDRWWDGKTSGAVKDLASYSGKSSPTTPTPSPRITSTIVTPPAAPTSTEGQQQASGISFEEAKRATNFTPIAPILIDRKFAANAKDTKSREFIVKLTRQLLEDTRADMRRNASANLPPDNVARALASSLSGCYQVAIARPGKPVGQDVPAFTKGQMESLRRQVALVLASNANFQKLGDRDKQELAEVYLLLPALTSSLYNAGVAKSNSQAQDSARDFARRSFMGILGVEPEKVHFTEDGLTL